MAKQPCAVRTSIVLVTRGLQLTTRHQAEQTWAPNNYNGSILYDYVVVMGELE